MKKVFIVDKNGIAMRKKHPEEEIVRIEKEFLSRVRNEKYFQDLLKRLCISEKEWLENAIEAKYRLILEIVFKKNPNLDDIGR